MGTNPSRTLAIPHTIADMFRSAQAIAFTLLAVGCAKPVPSRPPLQAAPVEDSSIADAAAPIPSSTLRAPLPMPPAFALGSNKFEFRADNSFRAPPFDKGTSPAPSPGALSAIVAPLASPPWKRKLALVVQSDPTKNAEPVRLAVAPGKCYRAFALLPQGAVGVLSLLDQAGVTVGEIGNAEGRSLLSFPEAGVTCAKESSAASVVISIGAGKSKIDVPIEIWSNE